MAAGTLTPAALNAISRAATALTTVYRNADQEMELIRNEETQTAAAAIAGGHGDLAILKAAADITDQQNQYRAAYFIEQGLATLQPVTTPDGAERLEPTLTAAGRRRFGLQKLTSYTDDDINALEQVALGSRFNRDQARAVYDDIAARRAAMKEALEQAKAGADPAPVFDPLTGQKLDQVPAGIRPGRIHTPKPGETRSDTEILQEQLERVDEILSEFRDEYPDALGMPPPWFASPGCVAWARTIIPINNICLWGGAPDPPSGRARLTPATAAATPRNPDSCRPPTPKPQKPPPTAQIRKTDSPFPPNSSKRLQTLRKRSQNTRKNA